MQKGCFRHDVVAAGAISVPAIAASVANILGRLFVLGARFMIKTPSGVKHRVVCAVQYCSLGVGKVSLN